MNRKFEHKNIFFKSLGLVSFITFISRVSGFARDTIVARILGAGIQTDAFFVAFKLPNLLRRIFGEGAFSQAFVPILAEYKTKNNLRGAKLLISSTSGLLILVLAILSVGGIAFSPWIILFTAPGFTHMPTKFLLTSSLLRVTFPYIFLISLTSLAGAVLNTWKMFSIPAFVPTLLNLSIIIFSFFAIKYFNPPIFALAWSVIVGGTLQLIFQLPFLRKIGMLVLPTINLNVGLLRVLKLMLPAIIGVSIHQISMLMTTVYTSFLISGSISWLYYADRLMEFPSGILGVSLVTILLPSLTHTATKKKYAEYSFLLDRALRVCLIFAIPSAVALGILAKPLIILLFQYKKFTRFDTFMTEQILSSYALGLIGLMIVKVLAAAFYSRQDIKTPVRVGLITLSITQVLNIIVYFYVYSIKTVGMILSFSAALNAILLYWQLRKKNFYIPQPGWQQFILRIIVAVMVMAGSLKIIMKIINHSDDALTTLPWGIVNMLTMITLGIIMYFGTLFLLGIRLRDLSSPTYFD
ncbi:MAG: murein biosynthesis integral membrane protein MurJ [Candidatus Dasytiphilus stammeri]